MPAKSWLHVALSVQAPSKDGFGMQGSGMFILNPPWLLHGVLNDVMPYLAKIMGQNGEGSFVLEFEENASA
jgi:23S rRNA (adenine2030-N6)-methyltransferase